MLERIHRQVDIQGRPMEMMGTGTLDLRQLPDGGLGEPRELVEREEELPLVDEQQNPDGDTLVKSTPKVRAPRGSDFIFVLPGVTEGGGQPGRAEPVVVRDLDCRLEPELGLSTGVLDVNAGFRLLFREEVEPKPES